MKRIGPRRFFATLTYTVFTGLVFTFIYITFWPATGSYDSSSRSRSRSSNTPGPEGELLHHLVPYNPKLPTDYGRTENRDADMGESNMFKISNLIYNRTNQKKNGFFVEFRAYDGVWTSNTLKLERDYNWTGLLIEAEPRAVYNLKRRNRKAWVADACLSPEPRAMRLGINTLKLVDDPTLSALGFVEERKELHMVDCYPLHMLLDALDVLEIDYFSLEGGGLEYAILKTIPWRMIRIKLISVETVLQKARNVIQRYLEVNSYRKIGSIVSDMDILAEIDIYELVQSQN